MKRSKIIAVLTGAISIILAIAYLVLAQMLDYRGEMQPAPQSQLPIPTVVAYDWLTMSKLDNALGM